MTDARYPERWLNDRRLLRLSDRAHRLFVTALTWSVANRTDGVITADDIELMLRVHAHDAHELVAAGLWLQQLAHWEIVDYSATQLSRSELEVLDNARRADREKKRRRRRAAQAPDDTRPRDCPPGHSEGLHRTGQDRPGQELQDHPRNCDCEDCWRAAWAAETVNEPL